MIAFYISDDTHFSRETKALAVFSLAQIQKGPSFFSKNMTEIELPDMRVTLSGAGCISSGVVFMHAYWSIDNRLQHFYIAVRVSDQTISDVALSAKFAVDQNQIPTSVKYYPRQKRIFAGLFDVQTATLYLGSWAVELRKLITAQEYLSQAILPGGIRQGYLPRITFRMVKKSIYCLAVHNQRSLSIFWSNSKGFVLLKHHELGRYRCLTQSSSQTYEAPLYAAELLASSCQHPNVYQIYRLQLKF